MRKRVLNHETIEECQQNIDFLSKAFTTSDKPTVRKSRDYLL